MNDRLGSGSLIVIAIALGVGVIFGSQGLTTCATASGEGTQTPVPTQIAPREVTPTAPNQAMTNPATWTNPPPPGPTQADQGAYTYWMHCMVCHGDRGQGLAVFRYSYPKNDQNCSSPKCHGGPLPPAGFGFPDAPAIMGDGTLAQFQTAEQLYAFVSTRMPYQSPGILSGEEYWNLVAYLLKEHNALPSGTTVNAADAGAIPVHPQLRPDLAPVAAAGALVLAAGLLGWFLRSRRTQS